MKYIVSVIFGLLFIGVLSFTVTPFLSDAYITFRGLEAGPDRETELFKFLLYAQWPSFFALGCFSGYFTYIKIMKRKKKNS